MRVRFAIRYQTPREGLAFDTAELIMVDMQENQGAILRLCEPAEH